MMCYTWPTSAAFDNWHATVIAGLNLPRIGHNTTAGEYRIFQGTTVIAGGSTDLDPHVWRAVFAATDTLHIDSVSILSGSSGTGSLDGATIGAQFNTSGAYLNGAIAEVIVVEGTLTAGEIADTEQYLADKWGITL